MKNIGIYARVSTKKQETQNQILKLKEYAKLREWEVQDIYIDDAVSGKKSFRPELEKMKNNIKSGLLDGVLVWKLDRLGRSTSDLINLIEFFRVHNCAFISYNNNMDTTTAEGKLLFTIIAGFAEFEASLISERTKLAYDRKKSHAKALNQKVRWGRKKKKLSDTEMNLVLDFIEKGMGLRKIADIINARRFVNARDKNKVKTISYSTLSRLLQKGGVKNGGVSNG